MQKTLNTIPLPPRLEHVLGNDLSAYIEDSPNNYTMTIKSVFYYPIDDTVRCAVLDTSTFDLGRGDILGIWNIILWDLDVAYCLFFAWKTDYAVIPMTAQIFYEGDSAVSICAYYPSVHNNVVLGEVTGYLTKKNAPSIKDNVARSGS